MEELFLTRISLKEDIAPQLFDNFPLNIAALRMFVSIKITNPVTMLMYGKEASNRKQEIDRQHYTIPNQRPKDKHCGKI